MRQHKKHIITHSRINDVVSVILIVIALYILILPLLPNLSLWWDKKNDETEGFVYQSKLVEDPVIKEKSKPIPKDNRLVLPELQLDQEIHEGASFNTLNKGLWRRPNTSSPDRGGNTVIVGHRFTYSGQAEFYHLDKMKVGDQFPLYWGEKEYNYEVYDISVVSPLAIEVENNTKDPILTLYTCTPIWSAKERLVIKSRLIEGS